MLETSTAHGHAQRVHNQTTSAAAPLLHQRSAKDHHCCTSAAPSNKHCRTTAAPTLHQKTPLLHQRCTKKQTLLHHCCTNAAPKTTAAPTLHQRPPLLHQRSPQGASAAAPLLHQRCTKNTTAAPTLHQEASAAAPLLNQRSMRTTAAPPAPAGVFTSINDFTGQTQASWLLRTRTLLCRSTPGLPRTSTYPKLQSIDTEGLAQALFVRPIISQQALKHHRLFVAKPTMAQRALGHHRAHSTDGAAAAAAMPRCISCTASMVRST